MKHNTKFLFIIFSVLLTFSANNFNNKSELNQVSSEADSVLVPIIMYHRVYNHQEKGEHNISPAELEADLKYLKEHGYNTVVIKDLIDFVYHNVPLPEKPIVLTFDDGNRSDYEILFPLLKQYDMKAVLSIIGKATDECSAPNQQGIRQPHLTWEQIEEIAKEDFVEFQNHSYNLHGDYGSLKRRSETTQTYQQRFSTDLLKLQALINEKIGIEPTTFTYPFGKISKESYGALINAGFKSSLSCYKGNNKIVANKPETLFILNRNNRPSGIGVEIILEEVNK